MKTHTTALAIAVLCALGVGLLAYVNSPRGSGARDRTGGPAADGLRDAALVDAPPPVELTESAPRPDETSTSASRGTRTPAPAPGVVDQDGDALTPPDGQGCDVEEIGPPPIRVAGAIRGRLVRESEPWTNSTLPPPRTVLLDLVSTAHPDEPSRRADFAQVENPDGTVDWTFEFPEVPEGEYELTLSALGTLRWSPTSLRVRAPQAGLVFTRFDHDRVEELALEVYDAVDGAPIRGYDLRHIQVSASDESGVFLHTGPLDLRAFPLDARFHWSLSAPGYATAFGDETAFVRESGRRVAVVRLGRGWATRVFVLVRDPTARAASGAEVLVDGVRAGLTGVDGMLVVAGEREPERVEVRVPGFHVPTERAGGDYSPSQRGGITVVMLERDP